LVGLRRHSAKGGIKMPSALELRARDLYEGYWWENQQILAWKNNMAHVPPPAGSTMPERFKTVWETYFDWVYFSNTKILCDLNLAIQTNDDTTIKNAIKTIRDIEHKPTAVKDTQKEAHKSAALSPYLGQLDELLMMEVDVQAEMANYVLNNSPPPTWPHAAPLLTLLCTPPQPSPRAAKSRKPTKPKRPTKSKR
jgi:hypothetical protein